MTHFRLNQKVRVNPANDNDYYNDFREEILVITNVAKGKEDHPRYDDSIKPEYLYDLKTVAGKQIPCSLYDYELIPA